MSELVDFINRCLDEDEVAALAWPEHRRDWAVLPGGRQIRYDNGRAESYYGVNVQASGGLAGSWDQIRVMRDQGDYAAHVARHDPASVLADVAAKRAILAIHADGGRSQGYTEDGYGYIEHCCETCGAFGEYGHPWPCDTVRALASAYRNAPGWDDAWGPT